MLSDTKIKEFIAKGEIFLKPFKEKNLGPNSYDLRISDKVKFHIQGDGVFDTTEDVFNYIETALPIKIRPGEVILFCSKEVVGCKKKTIGFLGLRSNFARSGLLFQFSPLIDTGFKGVVSGQIFNPTRQTYCIHPNTRIFQIMFQKVDGKIGQAYDKRKWSKNTNQFGIESVEYRIDKEWRAKNGELPKNYNTKLKVSKK